MPPWACDTCTLLNTDVSVSCAACGSARSAPPNTWACHRCSFHCGDEVSVCIMCGTQRRHAAESGGWAQNTMTRRSTASITKVRSAHAVHMWACSTCTLENSLELQRCDACGSSQPQSASSSSMSGAARLVSTVTQDDDVVQKKRKISEASMETKTNQCKAPKVVGSSMTVLCECTLETSERFYQDAVAAFVKPRSMKLKPSESVTGRKTISRPEPPVKGVLKAHKLDDNEEFEASVGLPAGTIGKRLSELRPGWHPVDCSLHVGNRERDFEDCMRQAVALNSFKKQTLVSFTTQDMYNQLGRTPGAVNVISKRNDWYTIPYVANHKGYCLICGAWSISKGVTHPRQAQEKMSSHQRITGHPFKGAQFVTDLSTPIGMQIAYSRGRGNKDVTLQLSIPLTGLLDLAAYTAYWPATSESAHLRICSRPLNCAENGLVPVELEPELKGGTLMAISHEDAASLSNADHVFNLTSAHDSMPFESGALSELMLPLSAGQLKTLRWALQREGLIESETDASEHYLSRHLIDRRFGDTDLVLQIRVERLYSGARGGILAHSMGYGKTAIMIGLIHCAGRVKRAVAPTLDPLDIDATLIITPENLFHQWLNEFTKFLGDSHAGLTMIALEDVDKLKSLKFADLRKADVVIVASAFFLSKQYERHFNLVANVDAPLPVAARYAALRRVCTDLDVTTSLHMTPIVLEMFRWKRVIFDEFHKCVSDSERYSASWRALHEIQARFRWGLTGTPDLTHPLRVSEMAALLHVFVPPDNRPEAQRFLDLWLRADQWDMSSIPVINHVVKVKPTPTERTLYLSKKRWLEGRADGDKMLLPFCSHFAPEELANATTATAAVEKMLAQHKAERDDKQDTVAELQRRVAHPSDGAQLRRDRHRLDHEESELQRMCSAITFFQNCLHYVESLRAGQTHECAVCLEEYVSDIVSITRCGHVFCTDCIASSLDAHLCCPTCRQALGHSDVDPISTVSTISACSSVSAPNADAKYGTKIAAILKELRRIHSSDAASRVLIFVQWDALLKKLQGALEDFKVPCLALRGGVVERQRSLVAFAEGVDGERFVLLLAMEHDDSGLNLTCSNHVFFVHPMLAEPEVARACERQALGRVRRQGQQRDVHLYRFVVEGTIEEDRARHHHSQLFQADGV